jgi:hypothetical protein
LWENQVQQLKEAWPLDRPRERQGYMRLELANDSVLVALPGKDPDRIRKDHPTIVFFDESQMALQPLQLHSKRHAFHRT